MSNYYSSLSRVLSPFRVQTKFEENSLPARSSTVSIRYREIMVFCIVLGDNTETAFPVKLPSDKKVGELRELITKINPISFTNIDAKDLILWQVSIPDEDVGRMKILNTKPPSDINIEELGGKVMSSRKEIEFYFPKDPVDEHIHIIIVRPQPPATTEKGKRPLRDSDEGQNSKRAKLADPSIISTARKIIEKIMKLSDDLEYYSNPKNLFPLPFPYPGEKRPMDRFNIDNDGYFNFMGRKKFRNVLKTIEELRAGGTGYMKLLVYGTVGYGKSHILSATACFLIRKGKRVVYLPDCRQLSVNPEHYVKSALFLAYHDNDAKISEINSCKNFGDIIDFCTQLEEKLYFIVDQMNALDEENNTGIYLTKKQKIRDDLDKMVDNHFYIMSSSANNNTMLHLMQKQTNEKKIKLFGGLDEEEMKEWWNKYNFPAMNEHQIGQIKDITGKIPLFLKFLLESDHKNFKDALEHLNETFDLIIQRPMAEFSDNLQSEGNQYIWDRHIRLMSSFLTNGSPPLGYGEKDYDHRYFYIDNGTCYYVCGLVRNCMADYLYEKGRMEIFVDVKWIKAFKNNPSVKGFIVEKACLASICKSGIMANKITFKVDSHEFFASTEEINFSSSEGMCTFYLPRKWNQKSIDGLLALYKADMLYIAPIQITFDKSSHSDSEGAFFSGIWPELKSRLDNLNITVTVIFIWITQKNEADAEVARKVRRRTRVSKNKEEVEINPDYTSVVTGFANVNRDIYLNLVNN